MSAASTGEPLRLVKLDWSMGGLCTGRTCSDPRPKHLSVVSSVREVIPNSAWGRYRPKDVLRGRPRCLVVYTKKIIKVKITEGITELIEAYIF